MTSEKLYYADSHIFEFSATVIDCVKIKSAWGIVLDRTAFFPEGGGQAPDTGYIGEAEIYDVQESDGVILHYTKTQLEIGSSQRCIIDHEQRLRRMQNHSGEHIVSGIVHSTYGYNNVGFHMGKDCMTIDFDGELTWDMLMEVELKANQCVRDNLPIRCFFPTTEELNGLDYRSKSELSSSIRIVEIEGWDRCACCAPHVSRTGEIGLIKIIDSLRHRGGVRLSLICGEDALDDYRLKHESVTAVSRLLSARRSETVAAVERCLSEQQTLKEKHAALAAKYIRLLCESTAASEGNICIFDDVVDEIAQRELVNLLMKKCGGLAAVFCAESGDSFRYIIGSSSVNLKSSAKRINEAINGRGGGKERMMQGRAVMGMEELKRVFSQLTL